MIAVDVAGVLTWTTVAAGKAPRWVNNEEAPPSTLGLWIGLGLCALVVGTITVAIRLRRRRRLRAISILPDDPFAVEAMQACVRLFCELDAAWSAQARGRLRRVLAPGLMRSWEGRLRAPTAGELSADGPLRFQYVGAADPVGDADRRAVIRVEGRLKAPSRQLALSPGQRGVLLSLALAILIAAFVGIALAPATKIRSAGATTIVVRDAVPIGGTHLLGYRKGAWIDLTVKSDVSDEVHFHGYDIHRGVARGRPVHFHIRATIEGSYPVELEQHAETLAQVTVQP